MSQKLKILAVDDDPLVTELIYGFLEADYLVEVAHSGDEGFTKFVASNHDIVMVDLIMPGLDGFGLIKKIQKTGMQTSIIVVSGADLATKKKISRYNVAGILDKPFSRDSLTKVLNKALSSNIE
ncbi:MAG: response regulator [Oligoflexales bacterium]|nr:response regulator [Oligoflexales bacterium]